MFIDLFGDTWAAGMGNCTQCGDVKSYGYGIFGADDNNGNFNVAFVRDDYTHHRSGEEPGLAILFSGWIPQGYSNPYMGLSLVRSTASSGQVPAPSTWALIAIGLLAVRRNRLQ